MMVVFVFVVHEWVPALVAEIYSDVFYWMKSSVIVYICLHIDIHLQLAGQLT